MSDNTIALTYANDKLNDGAGAQLHRIYGTFALSRALGVAYVHTPLLKLDYQGLRQLQIGKPDYDIVAQWNGVYHIESDVPAAFYRHIVEIDRPEPGFHETIIAESKELGRPTLVRITFPYAIMDRFPEFYEVCKSVSPFRRPPQRHAQKIMRIAIHLRRGDLKFAAPDRILPNSYYISTCFAVLRVLNQLNADFFCELHAEVAETDFLIKPGTWSAWSVSEDITIGPGDDALGEFDVIPNLIRCYNDPAIETLKKLATADVLIISKSSFSYLAGVLNIGGAIIYHPFWHTNLPDWIVADPSGSFDEAKLRLQIQRL